MAYTTINKSSDYFNTKTYTGTGSTQSITGVGFQPDMLWIKNRSTTSSHIIQDAVRGATKQVYPDLTIAELTLTDGVSSFGSDGFTVNTGASFNGSGNDIVSWNWKANGSGSSNTDGSITSTVSASTTSGFSIVSYTGTGVAGTVGHGLGVSPKMIILKNRDRDSNWIVYHDNLTSYDYRLNLDNNSSQSNSEGSTYWTADPTSTVFSIGTNVRLNASTETQIAYCFADVKGFSKFGEYIGTGSTSSPAFIYTGFAPRLVVVKRYSNTNGWVMRDSSTSFNGEGANDSDILFANTADAESNSYGLQLYSNGFGFTGSDSASVTVNGSGSNYIYMAWAEAPLVGSNNVPCTAR